MPFTQYIHPFGGQHGGDEVGLDHRWHGQFHHQFRLPSSSPSSQSNSGLHLPQILIQWAWNMIDFGAKDLFSVTL